MSWDKPLNSDRELDEQENEFFDDVDHTYFKAGKSDNIGARVFRRFEIPFLILGIAIVILIVLFFIFPKSKSGVSNDQLAALAVRLNQLEEKLINIEDKLIINNNTNDQADLIEGINTRSAKFESTISSQVEDLSKEVKQLEKSIKQISAAKVKAEPAPVKTVESTPAKPVETPTVKASGATYHHVQKGETVYRISKQYGLTPDQLRTLNKLENDAIYPGQKLLVKP
ncbi:MAG: LysM peptidoglycan-binding domain-containing protein [Desulfobacterales bacterium]|nr:LysM peptidoglycan-binding domain-containing protein [Desulfobacterales bacterium]